MPFNNFLINFEFRRPNPMNRLAVFKIVSLLFFAFSLDLTAIEKRDREEYDLFDRNRDEYDFNQYDDRVLAENGNTQKAPQKEDEFEDEDEEDDEA